MLIVLAHYPGDEEQALRLATWIRDLGPYPGHELLLIADVRSTRSLAIRAEFDGARFDKIEELTNPSIIDGWPHAANFVFSMAARHIAATNSRPFLFLEPDVVPMVKGWLDKLDAEYKSAGSLFMGDYVNVDNVPPHCSGIAIYPGDLIEAGAGNALIAGDIAWDCAAANQILPKLHKTTLIGHAWRHPPFNNQSEVDNLIAQHPQCVLFHADKSGTLINLLHERKTESDSQQTRTSALPDLQTGQGNYRVSHELEQQGQPIPVPSPLQGMHTPSGSALAGGYRLSKMEAETRSDQAQSQSESAQGAGQGKDKQTGDMRAVRGQTSGSPSSGLHGTVKGEVAVQTMSRLGTSSFSCDIFVKSYPPDYPWLAYCLRSIQKFASGFHGIVIAAPDNDWIKTCGLDHLKPPPKEKLIGEQPDGYLWQMVIKLDADRYTDASHILYIDSDTIFTRPVTPADYMHFDFAAYPTNSKVVWMLTPYEKVTTPWQQVIEKFLKKPVRFEFMRRQPFLVPRWLLSELRAFCEREHGVTLDSYVLSQPHRAFSEFNALGAFAYEFFRDEFVWVNTEETPPEQWPVLTVLQSWSRGGLTDEIKKRYEEILDGETSVVPRIGDNGGEEVQGNGEEDAPPEPQETSLPTLKVPVLDSRGADILPIRLSTGAAKWDRVEQLVLELKGYCDSPVATSRVRKALEGAKILPVGTISRIQRQKWRKNYRRKRKANRAS